MIPFCLIQCSKKNKINKWLYVFVCLFFKKKATLHTFHRVNNTATVKYEWIKEILIFFQMKLPFYIDSFFFITIPMGFFWIFIQIVILYQVHSSLSIKWLKPIFINLYLNTFELNNVFFQVLKVFKNNNSFFKFFFLLV